MSRAFTLSLLASLAVAPVIPAADEVPPNRQYQAFIQKQAAELRKGDKAPATLDEWSGKETELRKSLLAAWGGDACFLPQACDLRLLDGDPLGRPGDEVAGVDRPAAPQVGA
ncbi:MAG: hypothetical protein ACKODX_17040, partial [Gemmata sp.]